MHHNNNNNNNNKQHNHNHDNNNTITTTRHQAPNFDWAQPPPRVAKQHQGRPFHHARSHLTAFAQQIPPISILILPKGLFGWMLLAVSSSSSSSSSDEASMSCCCRVKNSRWAPTEGRPRFRRQNTDHPSAYDITRCIISSHPDNRGSMQSPPGPCPENFLRNAEHRIERNFQLHTNGNGNNGNHGVDRCRAKVSRQLLFLGSP